jgi:hypothetical protein
MIRRYNGSRLEAGRIKYGGQYSHVIGYHVRILNSMSDFGFNLNSSAHETLTNSIFGFRNLVKRGNPLQLARIRM